LQALQPKVSRPRGKPLMVNLRTVNRQPMANRQHNAQRQVVSVSKVVGLHAPVNGRYAGRRVFR